MITRSARLCLEFFIGFAAIVGLFAVLFVWRLSEEPLAIDFVKPHIEAAFFNEETGTRLEAEHLYLQWDQNAGELEVSAERVRAYDASDRLIAALPAVDVRLAWSALLVGVIAPQSIEIDGARLRLERTADGELRFTDSPSEQNGAESTGAPPMFSAFSIRGLIGELMQAPDPRRPLTYLESVQVTDGRVRLVDKSLGRVLDAEDTRIDLQRLPNGLRATLSLSPVLAGKRPTIAASVHYEPSLEKLEADFAIERLLISDLASFDDSLSGLAGVEIPLTAEGQIALDLDGRLKHARLGFDGKPGQAFLPKLFQEALPVSLLSGFMIYDAGSRRLTVNPLRLSFGTQDDAGPAFTASANVEMREAGWEVAAEVKGANVLAESLTTYWPLDVAQSGRAWVSENITAGSADDLTLSARFALGADGSLTIHDMEGGFAFDGLEIHYLRPVPPITGVTGRASLLPQGLRFDVESGKRGELTVTGAVVEMPDLSAEEEIVDIAFQARGPLAAALDELDHPRLNLVSRLGIAHSGATGAVSADVKMTFPMLQDLPDDRLVVSAKADITDGGLGDFIMSQPLSDGQLALEVTNKDMSLSGEAQIGGVPLSLRWQESFSTSVEPQATLKASIPFIDGPDRQRFGFDAYPYLTGPLALELEAARQQSGVMAIDFVANLATAGLEVPEMRWKKETGVPGRATGRVMLVDEKLERVEDIVLEAGDLRLSAVMDLTQEGDLERLDFANLRFGQQSVSGLLVEPVDGGYRASVQSGTIDLSPWLEGRAGEDEIVEARVGAPERAAEPPVDIEVTAPRLSRVFFAADRYLSDVSLRLVRKRGAWLLAKLDGRVDPRFMLAGNTPSREAEAPRETEFSLDWGPVPDQANDYRLDVRTSDLGAFLRAVDLYDDIEGGAFQVQGRSAGPFPEHPVELTVEGGSYRLVRAPIMARVLGAASLTGLGNLLSGAGIDFNQLTGTATYHELQFQRIEARTHGSSLGLTTKGRLDLDQDTLALVGEIVPAYTLNNAVSGIPLIGNLLTGGEGGGIIAFTYSVEGDISDPSVGVNPLSALAPGFLRNIFLGDPGGSDQSAAKPRVYENRGPDR